DGNRAAAVHADSRARSRCRTRGHIRSRPSAASARIDLDHRVRDGRLHRRSRHPLDEVLAIVADVDGWLSVDQVTRLYGVATAVAPGGQVVEIGSFRGRSTIVLASAVPDGVEVVAIDPHA